MDGNRYERLLNSVRKIVLEKYYFYFPRYNREIGDKKKIPPYHTRMETFV